MKFDYTDNMVTGIIDIIRGEKLGSGSSRMVYDFLPDENLVIKLESDYSFQNIIEWELWDRIKFTKHSEWFAPCHYISSNGKVLIQSKTLPVRLEELLKKIPVFFTDSKVSNWGILDGKIVCHDYGVNLMMERGMTGLLKNANWWNS